MRKLTAEDRIENILAEGTLAQAESCLERAQMIVRLRQKMAARQGEPAAAAEQKPLPLEAQK